jgi:hypothetical protein
MKPWVSTWATKHQIFLLKLAFLTVFLLAVAVGTYVSYQLSALSSQTNTQGLVITQLSKGLDASRNQLTDHGIKPTAPPASQIVKGVPGAPGVPGLQGQPGTSGPSGSPGTAGAPGSAGQPGTKGSPGSPGSTGQPGPVGSPGSPGASGQPGPGSTAAGPQGPQGIQGPPGVAGKDGAPGKDGTNGAPGVDGTNGKDGAGVSGWTWTDPATNVTYDCTRDADNSGHYTCAARSSTPPALLSTASNVTPTGDNGGAPNENTLILAGMLIAVMPEREIA